MTKRGKKRVLVLIMTLALVLGTLPTAAFAAGEGPPCPNDPNHEDCGCMAAVEGAPYKHTIMGQDNFWEDLITNAQAEPITIISTLSTPKSALSLEGIKDYMIFTFDDGKVSWNPTLIPAELTIEGNGFALTEGLILPANTAVSISMSADTSIENGSGPAISAPGGTLTFYTECLDDNSQPSVHAGAAGQIAIDAEGGSVTFEGGNFRIYGGGGTINAPVTVKSNLGSVEMQTGYKNYPVVPNGVTVDPTEAVSRSACHAEITTPDPTDWNLSMHLADSPSNSAISYTGKANYLTAAIVAGTISDTDYMIKYNSGTDRLVDGPYKKEDPVTVKNGDIFPEPAGKAFAGWSDSASGEVKYAAGATFPMPANDVTLYAVWQNVEYKVIYRANHAGGIPDKEESPYHAGDTVTVQGSDTFAAPAGKAFAGWSDSASGEVKYAAGATFPMPANDVILFAVWKDPSDITYNVIYRENHAGGIPDQAGSPYHAGDTVTVKGSEVFDAPAGKTFAGWSDSASGEVKYAAGATFPMPANDVVLYAVWKDSGGGSSSGGSDRDDSPSATDQAVSKIEKAKDGDTVKVDLPSNGKIPVKVLEEAAGKDVTLEIPAGSGVTWIVNGLDIPSGKLADLNLKVDAKADTIPVTVINALTGEQKVMQLALSHNGDFPFPLTLRLDAGKDNAGLFANLYYYNETAKELEYQCTAEIDADGNAHIPFAHASSYAVVIDKESHAPVVWENPFTDVGTTDWFYGAVEYVHQTGLMVGTTDTTFGPNGAVTRAQVWTVLARMDGREVSGGAPWYAPARDWAVVSGVSDGTDPDGAVTREQLVTMLYRYAQAEGMDVSVGRDTNILSYTDALDVAEWAIPAFQWACGAGVVSGTSETTLSPQAGATRAQLAAILQRFSSGTI